MALRPEIGTGSGQGNRAQASLLQILRHGSLYRDLHLRTNGLERLDGETGLGRSLSQILTGLCGRRTLCPTGPPWLVARPFHASRQMAQGRKTGPEPSHARLLQFRSLLDYPSIICDYSKRFAAAPRNFLTAVIHALTTGENTFPSFAAPVLDVPDAESPCEKSGNSWESDHSSLDGIKILTQLDQRKRKSGEFDCFRLA